VLRKERFTKSTANGKKELQTQENNKRNTKSFIKRSFIQKRQRRRVNISKPKVAKEMRPTSEKEN